MKSIYAKKLRRITAVGLVIIFILSAVGIKLYIDKTKLAEELSKMDNSVSELAEKASGGKEKSQKEIEELESRLSELEKENSEDKQKIKDLESENDKLKEMKKKKAESESGNGEKSDETKPTPSPQPVVPRDDNSSGKTVYLTFDDGPSKNTPKVLEVLKQYGVKATFFVIDGKGYNKYMKDIVNQGHAIGLHSETHDYKRIYSSENAYFNDIAKISKIVKAETGVDSKIIRFPGGSSNTVSKKYCRGIISTAAKRLHNMGYEYFDWNCDSGDAAGNNIPASRLVENIKISNPGTNRVVVLMHDAGNKSTTPQALPQIIEYFKSKGYSFGVLTEKVSPVHHKIAN